MSIPALDLQSTEYSLAHAYWLGKAARLAYDDESDIQAETTGWGFDHFQFFYSKHQLPFPLDDTQVYVVSSDHMIIVAFRGTEPSKIYDWLSDANTPGISRSGAQGSGSSRLPPGTCVHLLRKSGTRSHNSARTTRPCGSPDTASAAHWPCSQPPECISRIQNCWRTESTRSASHARAIAYLRVRTTRLSNPASSDSSTTMTSSHKCLPSPVYHHVNTMMYFDASGKLHEKTSFASTLLDRFEGFTADMFAPGTDGIRDHSMDRYLENLAKNLG